MNINQLKDQWTQSFEDSMTAIESYVTPQSSDDIDQRNFVALANWLLFTPISSYDFMPSDWCSYRDNPYKTESLLSMVHHALTDDGDICFVILKLKNEVLRTFMMFYPSYLNEFTQECLNENKSLIQSYINSSISSHRFMTSMHNKYPDRQIKIRPIISEHDFSFEVHQDPIKFMTQVDSLYLLKQKAFEQSLNDSDISLSCSP